MKAATLIAFLRRSFLDPRGVPDGKLFTLFAFTGVALLAYPIGWLFNKWPPDYIWISTLGLIAAGYGWSTWENRTKIKSEAETTSTDDSEQ